MARGKTSEIFEPFHEVGVSDVPVVVKERSNLKIIGGSAVLGVARIGIDLKVKDHTRRYF